MIARLVLLALMLSCSQQLWFKAFDRATAEPFCFVDNISNENDYIIKWAIDEKSSVDAQKKDKKELKPAILYFNITKFKHSDQPEADLASRKYIDHHFYDTSKADNHTKGSFHFSVEDGRRVLQ